MNNVETPRRTLSDCLHEGKLPETEALGYAVALAQELCRLHAEGRVHGGLSPSAVVLTEAGLQLLPADEFGESAPYMAPEVVAGAPCDVLSDVFSFGAMVYEMLSGRRAFDGPNPDALHQAIAESTPPPCGGAAFNAMIQTCLAKDPSARFHRVEKILMELRLAAIAGRLAQLPAIARWDTVAASLESDLRDVRRSLALQTAAIDSFQTEMKRNESLLGWVVDILEVLQINAMDQRGAPSNGGHASWPAIPDTLRDSPAAQTWPVQGSEAEFAPA